LDFLATISNFHFKDVQQFAVWEKDARDESGFHGYFYLDLFPRGELFSLLIMSVLCVDDKLQRANTVMHL